MPTYIIAEAGVNHNGSLDMACQLVDAAAHAGADAVKFQTFNAEKIVSRRAPKADYQTKTTDAEETQLAMIRRLQLDADAHEVLISHCRSRDIEFISTPFDLDSVHLLTQTFDLPRIKIPSGDITNAPLLMAVAASNKPVIVSTGMSTLGDVEVALGVLAHGYLGLAARPSIEAFYEAYGSEAGQAVIAEKVTLLHCTTEYPAPFADVNLRAMDTLKHAFNVPVGLSDHTPGIAVPIAAVARGATVIEKHFTLDRELPGPDHKASLEPDELYHMVDAIRQVEQALGSTLKAPAPVERKNKMVARKSLVAARGIAKGEPFTEENLTAKRPGNGISPVYYWEWLGKTAIRNYEEDDVVEP